MNQNPSPDQNSVMELTRHYKSIVQAVGDQRGRQILSGAKKAALGIMDPTESELAYHLYEAVEKNLFPDVQSSPR